MNSQAVDLLLQTLTQALRVAHDNTLKLDAFESALEQHQPELFRQYRETLQSLTKKQDFGRIATTLEALRKGLLQE